VGFQSLLFRSLEGFLFLGDYGEFRAHFRIQCRECHPLFGEVIFVKDRLYGALGDTSFTVDTLIGMDVKHLFPFVEALHGAYDDAIGVFASEAGLGNDMGHKSESPGKGGLR